MGGDRRGESLPQGDADRAGGPDNQRMTETTPNRSISERVRCARAGFREGWSAPRSEPTVPPALNLLGSIGTEVFRIVLFGFIIVRPGVPFLPWGDWASLTSAILMVTIVVYIRHGPARRLSGNVWYGRVVFPLALVAGLVASHVEPKSLVSIGTLVALVAALARNRPAVYVLVGGVSLGGIVMQILDVSLFSATPLAASRALLSPEEVGRQATLIAAVLFLAALQHLAGSELLKQKERADAAETARDEAAANERARIARELHDVVSHHVTAMTLQAEAAAATGDRKALTSLADSGREASAELRRMLGVLRRPAGDPIPQTADPQPRLADLDGLAQRLTGGLQVNVERTGKVRPLPAGVELCAFRVVQEALTNVAKHSDARDASVTVDYGPDHLSLEVLDDGAHLHAPSPDGEGHGLIGMRERVTVLDGTLAAGAREPGRGYRVFARIPL